MCERARRKTGIEMDALTIVDLKRMQKAGLLTLEEFLKEAAKLIKQAGDRAADDDDDVQIVGQARPYRWYSEGSDDRRAPAPAPAPAAEEDLLAEGSGLDEVSDDEENEEYRKKIVEEVKRKEEDAERLRLRQELDYGSSDGDDAEEEDEQDEHQVEIDDDGKSSVNNSRGAQHLTMLGARLNTKITLRSGSNVEVL